ncbi:hypothetical protein V6259_11055 [Marinomonas sp. TI.3.20]|uniref:hypothetical protein n=1 Tax=Marinomonas sp. TI.3.20 TaxID=3121296 RepID=UPI00311D5C73
MNRYFPCQTETLFTVIFIGALIGAASQAHAMDLVAFGQNCLKQEGYLGTLKQQIDDAEFTENGSKYFYNGARKNLESYNRQINELASDLKDCQEVAPNSAYCHEIRIRYNRLIALTDRAEEKIDRRERKDNGIKPHKLFFKKQHYDEVYAQFIAICRDSNTHYQLLQDSNAYSRVCSSSSLKKTTTCSF